MKVIPEYITCKLYRKRWILFAGAHKVLDGGKYVWLHRHSKTTRYILPQWTRMTKTVSITQRQCGLQFCFRIMFWLLDPAVHVMFVICCLFAQNETGQQCHHKYLKKGGPFKFQMEFRALVNYAIGEESEDLNGPHPRQMRQDCFIPCNCGECFFCMNGQTD